MNRQISLLDNLDKFEEFANFVLIKNKKYVIIPIVFSLILFSSFFLYFQKSVYNYEILVKPNMQAEPLFVLNGIFSNVQDENFDFNIFFGLRINQILENKRKLIKIITKYNLLNNYNFLNLEDEVMEKDSFSFNIEKLSDSELLYTGVKILEKIAVNNFILKINSNTKLNFQEISDAILDGITIYQIENIYRYNKLLKPNLIDKINKDKLNSSNEILGEIEVLETALEVVKNKSNKESSKKFDLNLPEYIKNTDITKIYSDPLNFLPFFLTANEIEELIQYKKRILDDTQKQNTITRDQILMTQIESSPYIKNIEKIIETKIYDDFEFSSFYNTSNSKLTIKTNIQVLMIQIFISLIIFVFSLFILIVKFLRTQRI